jgi:Carbohydrate esterase, sialic acid-specific acetylesterase
MARVLQTVIASQRCKTLLSSSLCPFDKARIIGAVGIALFAFHGNTVVAAEETLTDSTEVIQTVDAWQNGSTLPSTTGQVTTYGTCQEIIQHNLSIAPKFGYSVDNLAGTFTDPKTNITIRQGCTPAAPFYIPFPVNPPGGSLPSLENVSCPSQEPGTDVWYIIGQSNASNWGDGRYTAGQRTYMYGRDGQCYQASDPIAGTDGTGAGPWARLADLMVGQKAVNRDTITAVVIVDRAVGASSIKDWMPGRGLNSQMISSLTDAKLHGFVPTRIVWVQGEADALATTSTSEYVEDFFSMLGSIRALGIKAPVWVAQTTMCNLRTARDPNDLDVLWRTPDYYVDSEVGRQNVRAAQQIIGGWNENLHNGANLDSIDIALRRDGCHMGSYALDQEAQLWMRAFIHPN